MVENKNVKIMTNSIVIFFIEFPISGFRRTQYITELGLDYNVWGYLRYCGEYLTLWYFWGVFVLEGREIIESR